MRNEKNFSQFHSLRLCSAGCQHYVHVKDLVADKKFETEMRRHVRDEANTQMDKDVNKNYEMLD